MKIPGGPKTLIFLALVVVLLYTMAPREDTEAGRLIPAARRKTMGPLEITDLGGSRWTLAAHSGAVVLVNLWATWCGPCREEMPGLARIAKAYAPTDVAILGVSLDQGGAAAVRSFAAQYSIPYPTAIATAGFLPVSSVDAIPTTLLIDRQARLAKTYVGAVTEKTFRSDIDTLLREAR